MSVLHENPIFQRALALRDSGKFAESLQELDSLLQTQIDNVGRSIIQYGRVQCLIALNRIAEAKSSLEEAELLSGPAPVGLLELEWAFIAVQEGQYDTATRLFRSIFERYADEIASEDYRDLNWKALHAFGQSLAHTGAYTEAIKVLEKAISLSDTPTTRYAVFSELGEAHFYLGNIDQARQCFANAVKEELSVPESIRTAHSRSHLRYWCAYAAYAQGDFNTAKRELAAAAAIAPPENAHLIKSIHTLRGLLEPWPRA